MAMFHIHSYISSSFSIVNTQQNFMTETVCSCGLWSLLCSKIKWDSQKNINLPYFCSYYSSSSNLSFDKDWVKTRAKHKLLSFTWPSYRYRYRQLLRTLSNWDFQAWQYISCQINWTFISQKKIFLRLQLGIIKPHILARFWWGVL